MPAPTLNDSSVRDGTVISEITNQSQTGPAAIEGPPTGTHVTIESSLASSKSSETATWLAEKGLDSRFIIRNAETHKPTLRPMLNFNNLRSKIVELLKSAFTDWDKLRNSLLGRVDDVTDHIHSGCEQLATATIYILYSHLRSVAGKHDFDNADVYAKRCSFDYRTQLPKGCIYIIQQFGMCILEQTWKNPRVIHTWDKKNEKKYGLPTTITFSSETFEAFMTSLTAVGVTMDKLPSSVPPHTAWDSLIITAADPDDTDTSTIATDFNVFSVFPDTNYNLPRDVFLAIGLCGQTVINPDSTATVIDYYGPRAQSINEEPIIKAINGTEDSETVTGTRKRRKSIHKTATVDVDKSLPCTPFAHMTIHGIEIPAKDPAKARAWIYGRGSEADIIPIRSVGRGIDANEVKEFFKALFRNGP